MSCNVTGLNLVLTTVPELDDAAQEIVIVFFHLIFHELTCKFCKQDNKPHPSDEHWDLDERHERCLPPP